MALPDSGGRAAAPLDLQGLTGAMTRQFSITVHTLIIAGWTGRDGVPAAWRLAWSVQIGWRLLAL